MRRSVAFAVLSLALFGLTGCKGACRELSEKLCDCSTTSLEREVCIRRATNDEALVEPSAEDEAFCESKIEDCKCGEADFDIESTQGKMACGLARPQP